MYWPGINDGMCTFNSECDCSTKKNRPPSRSHSITADAPMQLIAIDVYQYDGDYFVTIMDIFSGFLCAFPTL